MYYEKSKIFPVYWLSKTTDMITFLECEQTCDKENAASILKNKVAELQELHGEKSCECHPDYDWKVAIDLTKKSGRGEILAGLPDIAATFCKNS